MHERIDAQAILQLKRDRILCPNGEKLCSYAAAVAKERLVEGLGVVRWHDDFEGHAAAQRHGRLENAPRARERHGLGVVEHKERVPAALCNIAHAAAELGT